jgi:hypothetical protein
LIKVLLAEKVPHIVRAHQMLNEFKVVLQAKEGFLLISSVRPILETLLHLTSLQTAKRVGHGWRRNLEICGVELGHNAVEIEWLRQLLKRKIRPPT